MDGALGHLVLFLAALLSVWVYRDIDQSSVLEHPVSSQLLVPLIASGVAFITSFAIRRLVGGPGRFDDDGRARRLEESRAVSLPQRPFRGSWALLSFLIAARFYLLSWLQARLQCSYTGVEAFLPVVLAAYECYWHLMSANHVPDAIKEQEEYDDIGLDTFEVLANWYIASPFPSIVGSLLLAWGFLAVTSSTSSSTIICPASASSGLVLFWQLSCLMLDAIIVTLTFRIIQWARSTADRVHSVGIILLSSAAFSSMLVLIQYHTSSEYAVAAAKSFNSLDFIHVSGQSIAFLFIILALLTTQSSPLAAASVLVFLCGAHSAGKKLSLVGTYEQLYKSQVILGTSILGLGFTVLAYRARIRHIGLPRAFIVFCLTAWVIGATAYCAMTNPVGAHPIDKIMYSTRTEVNRWLVQDAKVSESLGVAVREYQERHKGRKPPPNFDVWYQFATKRDSPIIDHFKQIDDDLEPFWAMSPDQISEGIAKLAATQDISIVSIENGTATSTASVEDLNVRDFVLLIQPFASYLPDMELPINLLDRPRVLAPWSHVTLGHQSTLPDPTTMWSWEHQHQLGQACPPKTPSSAGFYSPTAQFCGSCARPRTIGQFPTTADVSRDLCHQPDMLNLHSFYVNNHPGRTFKELLPVFGRAKTNQYKDILIPLSREESDHETPADETVFTDKENQLFYRGAIVASSSPPPTLLPGGQQERLSHLVNNASASDQVTVLLLRNGEDELFRYEAVSLRDMNRALKLDVGIGDYSGCTVPECEQFKAEFGVREPDVKDVAKAKSRYVMVMDGDAGPPGDLLQVVRSNSVPFVASIFKEWYTERLFPWLHYVPIDLRFHALHSTLAYFAGLDGAGVPLSGRANIPMKPQLEDAREIALEGRQWAARALRREDAAIYTFRLLLEWGRIVGEGRESAGFEMGAKT